jgi:hypothetical protein
MVRARQVARRHTTRTWQRSPEVLRAVDREGSAVGAAILGGHAVTRAGEGPWWAAFLLAALGLLALCLRIVFPQDSPDKLAWWRDRWRKRRHVGTRGKRT